MRPVLEVADVFRRHGEAFRRDRAAHLGRVERRVMAAIQTCRTATLGGHVEQCGACGLSRPAYNSCRNRHCPKCQGLARAEWLEARQAELLPVPYFHVVFTLPSAGGGDRLPQQARRLRHSVPCRGRRAARHRRRPAPPRRRDRRRRRAAHLGAGACSIIRTCTASSPGAGCRLTRRRWVACRPGFFLPVRVLSRRFRTLFLGAARGRRSQPASCASPASLPISPSLRRFAERLGALRGTEWVVYSQASVRRPRAGARLSRPLHPPRRHRQQPPNPARRRPGQLHLEGLPPSRQDQGDDAGGRRVHPSVPAARRARRLPPHPPCRLPRQRPPHRQARALPRLARGAHARAAADARPIASATSD